MYTLPRCILKETAESVLLPKLLGVLKLDNGIIHSNLYSLV